MTKGKYATRAARRREDESVQAEIGTYQRHVAQLTAEVSDLTGKLAAERAARKAETQRLRAQLEERLSPELAALREELEQQRQRAAQAEDAQRRNQQDRDREMTAMIRLLQEALGLTPSEAIEVLMIADPDYRDDDLTGARASRLAFMNTAGYIDGRRAAHREPTGAQTAALLETTRRRNRDRSDVVKLIHDKLELARQSS